MSALSPQSWTRREFVKTAGTAAAASLVSSSPMLASAAPAKRRYAMIGTGDRGTSMWGATVAARYPDVLEFVGLCDINPKRAEVARGIIGTSAPAFTDFDQMVRTTKPQTVIVTTIDGLHAQFVNRAMELGCDVISEKSLCTEAVQAQAIIDTQKKTGRDLIVTFNARYGASTMKARELLMAGEIGELYSVNYDEFLDLSHGADYFRRWHAFKENSGTLFCHKASHHFDELNWWIDADPLEVVAYGNLNKYGHNGPFRHANCRRCTFKDKCEFYWNVNTKPEYVKLYVDCEDADGYFRDGCVYRNGIDIYDSMSAQIKYANNVLVNYTLNAAVPYEGQFIVFNGSKGRIEIRNFGSQPWEVKYDAEIRLTRNFKDSVVLPMAHEEGEHGGADQRIRDMIFKSGIKDPLKQKAGMRAGIMSSLIGIAGYTSIEQGVRVRIADLVKFA
jgi:predicted dehydrogenase